MTRIVAIVPMRHNSERVLQKNYRPFAGKPLYHQIISTLQACSQIAEIVIDTDSPVIMQDARENFPSVTLLERPENLRDGSIPMNKVLLNTVEQLTADFYLQTHSTNPLLRPETLEDGIKTFIENSEIYDSLFSVTRLNTRLWDSLTRPVNHNPAILLRTQDLPPIYEENSCFYMFTKDILKESQNRIGQRPLMFEVAMHEAWDIDEQEDFEIAELMFHYYEGKSS